MACTYVDENQRAVTSVRSVTAPIELELLHPHAIDRVRVRILVGETTSVRARTNPRSRSRAARSTRRAFGTKRATAAAMFLVARSNALPGLALLLMFGCGPSKTSDNDSGTNGPPEVHSWVDPSLPPGIGDQFDALTFDPGLSLVYPNPGAVIPRDVAAIDVQGVAIAGLEVYRVRFAVDDGNELRGYVPQATWLPDEASWTWLTTRAAGHKITLTLAGAHLASGNVVGPGKISNGQPLIVSNDDATGALFYFATTGDQVSGSGVLDRLAVGSRQPDVFMNSATAGSQCVGCHAISRDGARLSFVGMNSLGSGRSTSLVDAVNPTVRTALAGGSIAIGAFNSDGTRYIGGSGGSIAIYDAATGALIAPISTSGPALYPDWSWDGKSIVFVRPTALCSPGVFDFGQKDIFVYGGSIVTMQWNGSTFTNEQVVVAPGGGFNNYYPAFSPDGSWIAFARARTTVASSWSFAANACNGQSGMGVSYDNPSASIWLLPVAGGGGPVRLDAANDGMTLANSWPKWAPKADGEYLWMSLSSTRPYGIRLAGADAHHQVWFTAVRRPSASGDPSSPAVWFPFQTLATKNHVGQWSQKVGNFVITRSTMRKPWSEPHEIQ
jgi:Tol biopolymer transport system component